MSIPVIRNQSFLDLMDKYEAQSKDGILTKDEANAIVDDLKSKPSTKELILEIKNLKALIKENLADSKSCVGIFGYGKKDGLCGGPTPDGYKVYQCGADTTNVLFAGEAAPPGKVCQEATPDGPQYIYFDAATGFTPKYGPTASYVETSLMSYIDPSGKTICIKEK